MVLDSAGNLYGTTTQGGFLGGTVFKVTAGGAETSLWCFGSNGELPQSALVLDSAGNLYGTTRGGGKNNDGTIFKISPSGVYSVLHSFGGTNDGKALGGPLTLSGSGDLYGVAPAGGRFSCGVVYELASNGTYSILHQFANTTIDGCGPTANLLRDSAGNLYGTTATGGTANLGTVFKLTGSRITLLYSFCTILYCVDGQNPSYVVRISNGTYYGEYNTTFEEGIWADQGSAETSEPFCTDCGTMRDSAYGQFLSGPLTLRGGNCLAQPPRGEPIIATFFRVAESSMNSIHRLAFKQCSTVSRILQAQTDTVPRVASSPMRGKFIRNHLLRRSVRARYSI